MKLFAGCATVVIVVVVAAALAGLSVAILVNVFEVLT
jgi:hypothetical protein